MQTEVIAKMSDDIKSLNNNEANSNNAIDEEADKNKNNENNNLTNDTTLKTKKNATMNTVKSSKNNTLKNTKNNTKNTSKSIVKITSANTEKSTTENLLNNTAKNTVNNSTENTVMNTSQNTLMTTGIDITLDTLRNMSSTNTDNLNEVKKQSQSDADITETEESDPANDESIANETVSTDANTVNESDTNTNKRTKQYKLLHIVCIVGFVIFAALFINEVVIQPIRIKNSIDLTRDLYKKPTSAPRATAIPTLTPIVTKAPEPTGIPATPTPDPNRDEQGRLLQFSELLAMNNDVKGWITIPETNIDYVVVQSDKDNPELYLDKDINLEYSKAGTLFLDSHSSVEDNSQNLIIHGHNMVSTAEKMFHNLLKYKVNKAKKSKNEVPDYYKEHPLINFDTIYRTGQWKIFAVFITNGSSKKEPFFDYTRSNFSDSSDFLNFVYQVKLRSELNIDSVDITDSDQLLMLSTCSYEVDNYRTVIVARRVRDGENPIVDTEAVKVNKDPLYPESYYYRYGGKAPELPATFEEALASGEINWYTPPDLINQKLNQELNNQELDNQELNNEVLNNQELSDHELSDQQVTQIPHEIEAQND